MELLTIMAQPSDGGGGGGIFTFLPFILIFVVFYFMLIRPQSKKQKQKQAMIQSLVKGDKVVTIGGLYGTIEGVKEKDDVLIVKIADNVKVSVSRNAIANKIEKKA